MPRFPLQKFRNAVRDTDTTDLTREGMLRCCPSGHALSKERNHEVHLRCDGACGTAVVLDA